MENRFVFTEVNKLNIDIFHLFLTEIFPITQKQPNAQNVLQSALKKMATSETFNVTDNYKVHAIETYSFNYFTEIYPLK